MSVRVQRNGVGERRSYAACRRVDFTVTMNFIHTLRRSNLLSGSTVLASLNGSTVLTSLSGSTVLASLSGSTVLASLSGSTVLTSLTG